MTASGRPATPADVDEICAALPHTWFGTTWGDVPTWLVPRTLKAARTGDREKGRGFLSYRKPGRTAIDPLTGEMYDDLLVVPVANSADKAELVEGDGPFFTIDHFNGYDAVLVQQSRLGELSIDELREVLTDAWRACAPAALVREFDE